MNHLECNSPRRSSYKIAARHQIIFCCLLLSCFNFCSHHLINHTSIKWKMQFSSTYHTAKTLACQRPFWDLHLSLMEVSRDTAFGRFSIPCPSNRCSRWRQCHRIGSFQPHLRIRMQRHEFTKRAEIFGCNKVVERKEERCTYTFVSRWRS